MSITTEYMRLTKAEFDRLHTDPDYADAFLGLSVPENGEIDAWLARQCREDLRLDIQRAAPGLHVLLTGAPADLDDNTKGAPFSYATVGGTDTEWESSYGPISYLTPKQVKQVAIAFDNVDLAALRQRYDPVEFNREDIYPGPWVAGDLPWLVDTLDRVKAFFTVAARNGEYVLVSWN